MKLYEMWQQTAELASESENAHAFWAEYFEAEKQNYKKILENKTFKLDGTLAALAEQFGMENTVFTGFLDGANTSLVTELDMDSLTEDSMLCIEFDPKKLYFNMLDAKADWLYNLPEWNDILTEAEKKEITKEWRLSKMAVSEKIGRNDACPCGSGKKYKNCCG